tara:strand:+ start:289 stop:453 length:165 start_codon:yes stop_codon:yes gene_type:complete
MAKVPVKSGYIFVSNAQRKARQRQDYRNSTVGNNWIKHGYIPIKGTSPAKVKGV